jgi:hypothetical protein
MDPSSAPGVGVSGFSLQQWNKERVTFMGPVRLVGT